MMKEKKKHCARCNYIFHCRPGGNWIACTCHKLDFCGDACYEKFHVVAEHHTDLENEAELPDTKAKMWRCLFLSDTDIQTFRTQAVQVMADGIRRPLLQQDMSVFYEALVALANAGVEKGRILERIDRMKE